MEVHDLMAEEDTSGSGGRRLQLGVDLIALLACAILIGSHISWIDDPWDGSHCGVNSGAYYGYGCRGLEAFGYAESRFQGPLLFHPDGKGVFIPYTNHPGTIYGILYPSYTLLGGDERSLRLPMLGVLIINILLIRFALATIIGPLGASAAVIGFTSLPMFFHYGRMVDLPMFCLTFFIPVTLLWLRYRRLRTGSSWACFAATAFVAGLFDWYCYFLVAAIGLDLLFCREDSRTRFRLGISAITPFALSFIVVFSWLLWAEGSAAKLQTTIDGLLMAVGIRTPEAEAQHFLQKVTWGEWQRAIFGNALKTMTLPFLIVCAGGVLTSLMKSRTRSQALRPGLMLLVAGLLPCLVFRTHAAKHEFWPMVGCAGLALFFGLGAVGLKELLQEGHRKATALLLVLLIGTAAWGAHRGHAFKESHQGYGNQKELAEALNRDFDADDLVITSDSLSPSRFYRDFVTVPQATTPRYFKLAIARLRDHRSQFSRVWLLWNKGTAADWQWLEDVPAVGKLEEVRYGASEYFRRELDSEKLWDW